MRTLKSYSGGTTGWVFLLPKNLVCRTLSDHGLLRQFIIITTTIDGISQLHLLFDILTLLSRLYIFQSLRCLPIKGFGRNRFLVISPLALLTYISDRRSLKWRGAFGYGRITSQRDVHWLCGGHGRLPLWSVLSNQGFQGPSMNGNPICNKKDGFWRLYRLKCP